MGYVAAFVVVVLLGLFAAMRFGTGSPDVALLVLVVLAGTAVAALAAVRVHLLRRRGLTWADLGVRRPYRTPAHLLWQIPAVMAGGVIASILASILVSAVLSALGSVPAPFSEAADPADEAIGDLISAGPLFTVLGLLSVAVVVPLAEEVVFRGIVLPALRARFRAAVGITLAGTVFALVHLMPPALPYLLVVGISLCAMAEWYRSIIPGIVLHGVNNAVVFALVLTAL